MNNDVYLSIIKKQQELINLMLRAGIGNENVSNIVVKDNVESKDGIEYDDDGFTQWLKKKGMSENSISSYSNTVRIFFRDYGVMNAETLARYESDLKENRQPKTVNLRIAGMTKYFKYLGYTEYEFARAKEQKRTFCDNAINEEQYNQLIDWCELNDRKCWLICKVIAGTGVRVSELISLKTADLDKGYADITGKGNKQRRIYYVKNLSDEIREYCGKVYIIENKHGTQMTTRGVAEKIKYAAKKAGIPDEVAHPHSFRHFFAKQFLKSKNDITLLGDLLGHSNISTTAIYTRLTSEEQQKEIEKIVGW